MALLGLFLSIVGLFIVISAIDSYIQRQKDDEIEALIERSRNYSDQQYPVS